MRVIPGFIICILLGNQLFSQRWENIYGNPNTDESFTDMIESYDYGYILSNYFESPEGNWIIKTDINGGLLWDKILTWENTSVYSGYIKSENSGDLIIAGTIHNAEFVFWPMLIKIDACGEKVWCRIFPQNNYSYGYYRDVVILENNDILAIGYFESDSNLDQVYLDYVDEEGSLLWRKAYATKEKHPLIAEANGISLQTFNNEYYINGRCYWPYPSNPNHVYLRPMFIAIDSLFNEKWLLPFGVNDSLVGKAYCMTTVNDSIFFGAGMVYEDSEIISLLMTFDKYGNEIDFNTIQNEAIGAEVKENLIRKIQKINDSLYMALASWGNEVDYSGGEFVIDTAGTLYNFQARTSTLGNREVIKTVESNYVIGIGYREGASDWDILMYKINENLESVPYDTNQYTYDSLCPYPISSGIIDISDCMIWVNTDEVPTPEDYYRSLSSIPITAYPNPAKDKITFSLGNTQYHQNINLHCYDIFGRLINEQKIYSGQLEAEAEVSSLRKGMYVAVVRSEGKVVGKCKFVVE